MDANTRESNIATAATGLVLVALIGGGLWIFLGKAEEHRAETAETAEAPAAEDPLLRVTCRDVTGSVIFTGTCSAARAWLSPKRGTGPVYCCAQGDSSSAAWCVDKVEAPGGCSLLLATPGGLP